MTRSNIHIHLSNGYYLECVADSSSAPEQGYIVEQLFVPLVRLNNPESELLMLKEHCTMGEQRSNATYRYIIDLRSKKVQFFEEAYSERNGIFILGNNLTNRLVAYCAGQTELRAFLNIINHQIN